MQESPGANAEIWNGPVQIWRFEEEPDYMAFWNHAEESWVSFYKLVFCLTPFINTI